MSCTKIIARSVVLRKVLIHYFFMFEYGAEYGAESSAESVAKYYFIDQYNCY